MANDDSVFERTRDGGPIMDPHHHHRRPHRHKHHHPSNSTDDATTPSPQHHEMQHRDFFREPIRSSDSSTTGGEGGGGSHNHGGGTGGHHGGGGGHHPHPHHHHHRQLSRGASLDVDATLGGGVTPNKEGFVPPWDGWDFNEWEQCADADMTVRERGEGWLRLAMVTLLGVGVARRS